MLIHLFRVLWVVMDSNHRRHRQQIYSLPHLATLVFARPQPRFSAFLNCDAKVRLFF